MADGLPIWKYAASKTPLRRIWTHGGEPRARKSGNTPWLKYERKINLTLKSDGETRPSNQQKNTMNHRPFTLVPACGLPPGRLRSSSWERTRYAAPPDTAVVAGVQPREIAAQGPNLLSPDETNPQDGSSKVIPPPSWRPQGAGKHRRGEQPFQGGFSWISPPGRNPTRGPDASALMRSQLG